MSTILFRKLQRVVQRHLYIGLAGASFLCGGCLSCTRGSVGSHIEAEIVAIPRDKKAALLPYVTASQGLPAEVCADLCSSVQSRRGRGSCSFAPRAPVIACGNPEHTVLYQGTEPFGAALSSEVCQKHCGPEISSCSWSVPSEVVCHYLVSSPMAAGRRPPGLLMIPSAASASAADWFARSASLESAAVIAFTELYDELRRIGAPLPLREGCLLAAEEEVVHARLMTELARDAGITPSAPAVTPCTARSAFQLAVENAVEGCVRETFGALEALWQSRTASDPAVRAVMAHIAEDEARHAQLAFALHGWLQARLSPSQKREVLRSARTTFLSIQRELLAPSSEPALGLLRGPAACEMFRATLSSMWPELFETRSEERMSV